MRDYYSAVQQNFQHSQSTPHLTRRGLDLGTHGALSLSRLAVLQGHAVGYHEFERLAQDLDGRTLRGVPLAGQIAALWRARFPQGGVRAPDWPPRPGDVPALWLGPAQAEDTLSILVVLGALTNGALSCLDEHGKSQVLRPEQARLGRLLVLESDPGQATVGATERLTLPQQAMSQPVISASRSPWVLTGLGVMTLIALVFGLSRD